MQVVLAMPRPAQSSSWIHMLHILEFISDILSMQLVNSGDIYCTSVRPSWGCKAHWGNHIWWLFTSHRVKNGGKKVGVVSVLVPIPALWIELPKGIIVKSSSTSTSYNMKMLTALRLQRWRRMIGCCVSVWRFLKVVRFPNNSLELKKSSVFPQNWWLFNLCFLLLVTSCISWCLCCVFAKQEETVDFLGTIFSCIVA